VTAAFIAFGDRPEQAHRVSTRARFHQARRACLGCFNCGRPHGLAQPHDPVSRKKGPAKEDREENASGRHVRLSGADGGRHSRLSGDPTFRSGEDQKQHLEALPRQLRRKFQQRLSPNRSPAHGLRRKAFFPLTEADHPRGPATRVMSLRERHQEDVESRTALGLFTHQPDR